MPSRGESSRDEPSRVGTDGGQIRWKGTQPGKDAFSLLPRENYAGESPLASLFLFFYPCYGQHRQKMRVIVTPRHSHAELKNSAALLEMHDVSSAAHFEELHLTFVTPRYFNRVVTAARAQLRRAIIQDFNLEKEQRDSSFEREEN